MLATWVIADSAMLADGIATALFFATRRLRASFQFTCVRMTSDGLQAPPGFDGELFV